MICDAGQAALDHHRLEPGKRGIQTTKRIDTQSDLALAYFRFTA
ncbi:hypothetical protein [Rhizobium nepotum]